MYVRSDVAESQRTTQAILSSTAVRDRDLCHQLQSIGIRITAIENEIKNICIALQEQQGLKQTGNRYFEVTSPLPCYDELILAWSTIQIVISFLLGANKSHMASSDDLQQLEMDKFTPSRNQFIPA